MFSAPTIGRAFVVWYICMVYIYIYTHTHINIHICIYRERVE